MKVKEIQVECLYFLLEMAIGFALPGALDSEREEGEDDGWDLGSIQIYLKDPEKNEEIPEITHPHELRYVMKEYGEEEFSEVCFVSPYGDGEGEELTEEYFKENVKWPPDDWPKTLADFQASKKKDNS